jgi:hypothetical protein
LFRNFYAYLQKYTSHVRRSSSWCSQSWEH